MYMLKDDLNVFKLCITELLPNDAERREVMYVLAEDFGVAIRTAEEYHKERHVVIDSITRSFGAVLLYTRPNDSFWVSDGEV